MLGTILRIFYIFIILASICSYANTISQQELIELKAEYKRPKDIPYPKYNPYSKEKLKLGKLLFFDPRLSGSGTQSCATCHNPSFYWSDGMATATGHGHNKLSRKTPSLLNIAWNEVFMWDGRDLTLESQVSLPLRATDEMNTNIKGLLVKLNNIEEYKLLFKKAFPTEEQPISQKSIEKAIATFERSIISEKSPFDDWIEGNEDAISKSAKQGFILFNTKAGCAACHSEWNFTDDSLHDIGLPSRDIGRGKFDKSRISMLHAFKTPGLRNIAKRSPYMHDGSLKNLDDVIKHYDNGFIKRKSLSSEIRILNLTQPEKDSLVDFLNTLTSQDKLVALPVLPK